MGSIPLRRRNVVRPLISVGMVFSWIACSYAQPVPPSTQLFILSDRAYEEDTILMNAIVTRMKLPIFGIPGNPSTLGFVRHLGDVRLFPRSNYMDLCKVKTDDVIFLANTTFALDYVLSVGACRSTVFNIFSRQSLSELEDKIGTQRLLVTGFDSYIDMSAKRLQLLTLGVPSIKSVGVILDSTDTFAEQHMMPLRIWASQHQVELETIFINYDKSLAAQISNRADAYYIGLSGSNWQNRRQLMLQIKLKGKPSIAEAEGFLEFGAMFAYQVDRSVLFDRVAAQLVHVANGTAPSIIPIERVRTGRFTINAKVVKTLNIQLAPSFLKSADRVIN